MSYEDMSIGYINIALLKYWCKDKYNPYLVPLVPSISLRSDRLFTITKITKSDKDEFILNNVYQDENETKKIFDFVDKVVPKRHFIRIESTNNMPTAVGFASSSSAYCALTKEINRYFKLNKTKDELCRIASIGSGSSARSFNKLCAFDTDQNIYELNTNLELKMIGVVISTEKKFLSSRLAMQITKDSSSILDLWVSESKKYFEIMLKAIEQDDFDLIGQIMEKSTNLMHETMLKSEPSLAILQMKQKNV